MDAHELMGGNTTRVIRIGDTVRRAAGPWTQTVQGYLRHVRAHGVAEVPEPFGVDDRGREIVTYLPGDVPNDPPPPWLWADVVLDDAGSLLRRLHDASVGYAPARPAWRVAVHEPAEVVCHNDFAPYNLVFERGRLVGVIDFDTASPGPRIWDVAYLAYRLAPFAADAGFHGGDRERAARLGRLLAAYGAVGGHVYTPDEVLRVMVDRLTELAGFTDQRHAETGREDFVAHAAMYRGDAARIVRLLG